MAADSWHGLARPLQENSDEREAARTQMIKLLVRAQAIGMAVTDIARLGGVSRDTAHRLLRDARSKSRRRV